MKKLLWSLFFALFAIGCSNLEDAKPEVRNSFVYFYDSDRNMVSSASALDGDGVITVGYSSASLTDLTKPSMILMKTDLKGKTLWKQDYPQLAGKGVAPISDGYLVVADSIEIVVDTVSSAISTNYYLKFFKMNQQGKITYRFTSPPSNNSFLANAITADASGNAAVLGTVVRGANDRLSLVIVFQKSGTSYTPSWSNQDDLITRSYSNGKTMLSTVTNEFIFPTSILAPLNGRSYAAFPLIKTGQTFNNNGTFGENDGTFNYNASDLQRNAVGFGAIGTVYTVASGSTPANTNFYFMRLLPNGSVMANSDKYYDNGVEVDKATSIVEDNGVAIAACADGGFLLAGVLNSTPTIGNGGKDVSLIRIDFTGTIIWSKTYGGSGDEVVNSVIEAPDGGFFVCGTSTVQNFSSMFTIKTNKNGDLTN